MDKALEIQRKVIETLGIDEVYLVGGSVRDLVMGNTPKDYDFTTFMLPDDVEAAVAMAGRRPYTIGKKFGTIGFKVPTQTTWTRPGDGQEYRVINEFEYVEVTTFRSEVYGSKSRKPEVKFVPSLDEDLARRDFTFNAMVLKPDSTIYDPYGGKLDIHAKMIKTVGMPKDRIQEDPLRMLRAARFAARYGFKIDASFIGKARHLADRIYDVSVERWVQEMDKLLLSDHRYIGLTALDRMGLLERILPELGGYEMTYDKDFKPSDAKSYESADLAWRDLLVALDENTKIAKYIAGGICQRLKFSNARTDIILDKLKKEQV